MCICKEGVFSLSNAFKNQNYLVLETNTIDIYNLQQGTNFHKLDVTLVFNIFLDLYVLLKSVQLSPR